MNYKDFKKEKEKLLRKLRKDNPCPYVNVANIADDGYLHINHVLAPDEAVKIAKWILKLYDE